LAGSSIPFLVVGIVFLPFIVNQPSPGLVKGMRPITILFHSLPNLAYLDLGRSIPSDETLLAIITSRPTLRSLVGLGTCPLSLHSSISLLSFLSPTLYHLDITAVQTARHLVPSRAIQSGPVQLPHLRSFEYFPFKTEETEDTLIIGLALESPSLQTLNSSIRGGAGMGLGWAQRLLELLGARSATEFTSSTLHFGSDPFRTRMVKDTPSLQTLVLQLTCTRLLWRPVVSKVPVPSIRTIILC